MPSTDSEQDTEHALARTSWRSAAFVAVAVVAAACSAGKTGAMRPASSPSTLRSNPTAPVPARRDPGSAGVASWRLPARLSREVALGWKGSLLVAGGLTASGTSSASITLIDPSTGSARQVGALAEAVHDAGGAVIAGAAFVFGGGATATIDAVQRFVPGEPGRVVGHLPQPRSDLSVAVGNGTAYVVGGYDGTHWLPSVLATRDGTHFARVGTLAVPVRYAASVAVDGALYVFGGTTPTGTTDAIQRLDLATGRTTVVAHLPGELAHSSAVALGSKIFVFGGRAGDAASRALLRFDPTTRSIAQSDLLPIPVADAGAAVIDGSIFLAGGETPLPTSRVLVVRLEAPR